MWVKWFVWVEWLEMRHPILFATRGMFVSFIVSSIDFRQFQNFLLFESPTVFPRSKRLELRNPFFLWFRRSLCCLKTVWNFFLNCSIVEDLGVFYWLVFVVRASWDISLSNHFSLKDISLRRLFVMVFIFRHRSRLLHCEDSFHGIKRGDNIFRWHGVIWKLVFKFQVFKF